MGRSMAGYRHTGAASRTRTTGASAPSRSVACAIAPADRAAHEKIVLILMHVLRWHFRFITQRAHDAPVCARAKPLVDGLAEAPAWGRVGP